jgi:hypothetical protein
MCGIAEIGCNWRSCDCVLGPYIGLSPFSQIPEIAPYVLAVLTKAIAYRK